MRKTTSSTSRRALALAVLAAAACAAAPSSSLAVGAETFCVHQSGYVCPAGSIDEGVDLQSALDNAKTNPVGADTPNVVDIGPGTYTSAAHSGFMYASANPLKITGAGAGQTTLANLPTSGSGSSVFVGGAGIAPLGYTAVTLSGVSLNDASSDSSALVLINGAADHIAAQSTAANVMGLSLEFSTVSHSTVNVSGSGSTGASTSSDGTDELSDVTVSAAAFGVRTLASTTLLRTNISAGIALQDLRGSVEVEDSLLRGSSYGLVAADQNGQVSIHGGNNTIVHTDGGVAAPSYGVYAQSTQGNGADIGLVDSIISGFNYPFGTDAESGSATIEETSNNYDGTYLGGGVTTTGPIAGNPDFADPAHGDYHLAANSSLIDATGVKYVRLSTTDLDGNPRVVAVNHPSTPLDLGAYEYQPPAAGGGNPGGGTPGTGGGTPGTGKPAGGSPTTTTPGSGTHGTTGSAGQHGVAGRLQVIGHPAVHGRTIRVTLRCTGGPCNAVTVTATHTQRRHAVIIASLRTRLAAGRTQTLTLALNRSGRALISRVNQTPVVITVTYGGSHRLRAGTVRL